MSSSSSSSSSTTTTITSIGNSSVLNSSDEEAKQPQPKNSSLSLSTMTLSTNSSHLPTLKISMTSDIICPWCFIGRRRLQRALESLDSSNVRVEWEIKPFFLNSFLPSQSIPIMEHLTNKFGSSENVSTLLSRMIEAGKESGISFNFNGRIGNSMYCHRLMNWIQRNYPSLQLSLLDALFTAYFEQLADIADLETLVTISSCLDLNPEEIRNFLLSHELESDVQKQVIEAYRTGVTGVPHFKLTRHDPPPSSSSSQILSSSSPSSSSLSSSPLPIDRAFDVSGGESTETFILLFERLGLPIKQS